MEFPRLNDTKYPNLGTVDVYKYQNDFDYTRWVPNTKLNLVNVRWNGDYNDVVKFESDGERDKFFDELSANTNCSVILNTNLRMDKSQVKVPIPFDEAVKYNYLVVDIPIATSSDNMLNYESSGGFRRWHFFIQDWQNTAPSTTILTIALDVWTQYINSIGINYMLLERGHAPVAASDTDAYLSDPMNNSEYLLAPDVDFKGETISSGGKFIPFGNGDKYICFASTCPATQLSSLGSVKTGQGGFTDPTFSDASNYPDSTNRWGYQYVVNGFSWGTDKSYSGTATPAGNALTTDGRIPNNTTVYAIPASDANQFFTDILKTQPTFLKTILGCFMVDQSLVATKARYTLGGHTVYELQSMEKSLGSFTLTKDMFNYPEKYERYTKLYTYPYAELEVTNNDGKTATVRIESTSNIRAQAITSVAFPYLNMRVFLTGISGTGSQFYKWTDLYGSHDESIANSDWYKFCYDFNIPMYALYMDGQTAWNISNYNRSIEQGKSSALVNYHNSVRQADNANAGENALASTAQSNANASGDTNALNLKRTASTQETNTNNEANTFNSNQANNRACATDITANNNACSTANMTENNSRMIYEGGLGREINSSLGNVTNEVTETTVAEENQSTVGTAMASMVGSIAGGIVSIAGANTSAVGDGGRGAVSSGVGQIISGVVGRVNAGIISQCNTAVGSAQRRANSTTTSLNNTQQGLIENAAINQNVNINTNNVNNATANTARDNTRNSANTANTVATMKTNAANSRATAHANADATNSTIHGNSARTYSTSTSNSLYTRNAAVTAAQDILRNTQNTTKALVSDSANMDPVQLCPTSGDATTEYMRNRGVQIKVRTQPKSSIKMAGDVFVRYGYTLNQIWNVEETGLCLMNYFTYWKSTDCWIYDKCETNDTVQNSITALFNRGVTVWSDPYKIGKVNPYDN